MHLTDRSLRLPVGIGAILVILTMLGTIPLIFIATAKPAWFLFSFEAIMPVPAVLGLLYARGMWKDDTGLGLACVAGTILFGSVLAYVSVPLGTLGTADGPVGALSLKPWLAARLLAALLIAWPAVRIGLRGESARWRSFIWGSIHAVIALGIMGSIAKFRNSPWMSNTEGNAEIVRMSVLGAGALVTLVCLCAGTHYLVRAFDPGEPARTAPPDENTAASATPAPGSPQAA
jgi:hypothetical protein